MMDFRPTTAREALLELRGWASRQGEARNGCEYVAAIADAGLAQTGMANFELTDQLADRLAEAHSILDALQQQNVGSISQGMDLRAKIDEALALPPDLEQMVDRRKVRL